MIRINVRENAAAVNARTAVLTPRKTSELINDSEFQTAGQVESAVAPLMIRRTKAGAPAYVQDAADNLPAEALTFTIDPLFKSIPSPTNPLKINGSTSAQLTICGKNIAPVTSRSGELSGVNFVYDSASGTVTLNGTATANITAGFKSGNDKMIFRHPGSVTLSGCPGGGSTSTYWLEGYMLRDNGTTQTMQDTGKGKTASGANCYGMTIFICVKSGYTCNNLVFRPQVEFGASATAFEPYHAVVHDFAFPAEAGTVYGGTLDATNGTLRVNFAKLQFSGSSVCTSSDITDMSAAGQRITRVRFRQAAQPTPFPPAASYASPLQTRGRFSHGAYNANPSVSGGGWGGQAYHAYADGSVYVLFIDCDPTPEAVGAYLDGQLANGTPVEMSFPLAEETAYPLTPQEVRTIPGVNNMQAGQGTVSVTYRADPTETIEELTAAIVALGGNV